MKRSAGIYLHPTSFPSKFGIGDLGDAAFAWIAMLGEAGQSSWQFSPLGPVERRGSPYQCAASFAGNPLLISPVKLREKDLLTVAELEGFPALPSEYVDYPAVTREKEKLFRLAFGRFKLTDEFQAFCKREKYWLDNYTLYCALKEAHAGAGWPLWDAPFKLRNRQALAAFRKQHADELRFHAFLQFIFHEQWAAVRAAAAAQGVELIGDIPIYVAMDSADAWSSPELFEFDKLRNPLRVSGVPPDYYSSTGQLWGNPVYRWDVLKKDNYAWWVARIKRSLEFADIVRIDHFRAFESFWAVKAGSENAMHGEWVPGPGLAFFRCVKKSIGSLPFIAEDLGVITDEVKKLRDDTGLPGMKVLQFAFDGNTENPHLPHNIPENSVVYTGTHDNDTTAGWLNTLTGEERGRVNAYLGSGRPAVVDDFIRLAYATPAARCIVPLQDVLCLDSKSRMNTPGRAEGNWRWRCPEGLFRAEKLAFVKELADMYGRKRVKQEKK
ncbi:MAG TPA: 4-alpha-glucanotransferase [Chitinivibrionales bacterium]|nr:4-alpha-glucanotransferase [Chitinivibrionales bacterium]